MIGRVVLCLAAAAAPAAAQDPAGSLALGVRGGIELHRGELGEEHVGVQAWIPLRDRLDVVPALDFLYQFPDDPLGAWSGRAWQTYVTLRVRPFNQGWLPGGGVRTQRTLRPSQQRRAVIERLEPRRDRHGGLRLRWASLADPTVRGGIRGERPEARGSRGSSRLPRAQRSGALG